jgi:hypothetical protein
VTVELILYVAGQTAACARARRNLERVLADRVEAEVRLEVREVAEHIDSAERDHVVFTPTLIVRAGGVETRAVGDLADAAALDAVLALARESTA